MLEMLLLGGGVKEVVDGTGPGNNQMLFSYSKGEGLLAGYFGRVNYTNLLSGEDLAAAIGLTTGTAFNGTVDWLKFHLDGKILFTPQKPFRYGLTWKSIYDLGAAYGDDTTGDNLPTSVPAVLQNKIIAIGPWQFRVRLMTMINPPPNTGRLSDETEWDRLIYSVMADQVTGQQITGTAKWDSFTPADIGITGTNGIWHYSKSPYYNSSNYTASKGVRGSSSVTNKSAYAYTVTNVATGWRPVLELIPPTT